LRLAAVLTFAPALWCQTIPIEISVNWPPAQLIMSKYGPIPKWATFAEIIGCNHGGSNITFGEGDVIAALRKSDNSGGLQAFSRQDAFSLVANSQSASKKNTITAWFRAAADSIVDATAAGLIDGGNGVGIGIVGGAGLVKILLKDSAQALSLRSVIAYNADGLQGTMAVPAGRCTSPASILFAVPASAPKQPVNASVVFTLDVPVDR